MLSRVAPSQGWCIALAAAWGASEIIMGAPLKADDIYGLAFLSLLICCSLPPLIKVIGRAWDEFLVLDVRIGILIISVIPLLLIAIAAD